MATPQRVQYVNTGLSATGGTAANPVLFKIPLPNFTLAGNGLVLGFQFADFLTLTSVTDDKGNTWTVGPSSHNATKGGWIYIAYCLNVTAGTRLVTVTLANPFNAGPHYIQGTLVEVAFISGAGSGADGQAAQSTDTASPYTTGSITTTTDGDYLFTYGACLGSTNGSLSRIVAGTAGSGFALIGANVHLDYTIQGLGAMAQEQVWASHGAVNPDFTTVGDTTAVWASAVVAFKQTSTGTLATQSPRVVGVHHQNQPHNRPFQCPYLGTSLVGMYNDDQVFVTTMTDGAGNSWQKPASGNSQVFGPDANSGVVYALGLTPNSDLRDITMVLTGAPSGHPHLVMFDCVGLASFDKCAIATGRATTTGPVTTVSITPSAAGGIVFGNLSESVHDCQDSVGSGFFFDSVVESSLDDANLSPNSPLDEDNGNAHVYPGDTSTITFVWTCNGSTGIDNWAASAASFLAAPSSDLSVGIMLEPAVGGSTF